MRESNPSGRSQQAFYDQTVEQLDRLVQARQSSVTASDGSLPLPLYILLGLGGVLVIALACTLESEQRRSHLLIVCTIAVVISFMLALVVSFDHPFSGNIAVTDRPIKEFLTFRVRCAVACARSPRRASRPTWRRGPRPCPRPAASPDARAPGSPATGSSGSGVSG